MIRVLIVDDERLARVGIKKQLARFPDLEVVGECGDGASAVEAIQRLRPDLVFLDVAMPGGDAFEVIARVGPTRMPAVVFVTAYDEHAIRAFETDAVDYLLKPVDPERVNDAVSRALRRLDLPGRLEAVLKRLQPSHDESRRIAIEEDGRFHFVDPRAVTWVEADGNYALLHAGGRAHRLRTTLEAIQQRLGPAFLRVGRSILVNGDAVTSAEPYLKGSYVLVLRCGTKIRTSRHFRVEVLKLIGRD